MEFTACLASVCLPDYWGGHHLAHISVPVDNRTTMSEFKRLAKHEVLMGAVMGADYEAVESQEWYDAAMVAIDNMETKTPGYSGPLFPELEESEEYYCESVMAYIVFADTAE